MIEDIFDSKFDKFSAFELYLTYCDSSDDAALNSLMKAIFPLARKVYNIEINPDQFNSRTFLEGAALEDALNIVSNKDIPDYSPGVFSRYLYTTMYRSMLNSLNRMKSQEFEFWKICSTPIKNHNTTLLTEARIYKEEVANFIYDATKARIRFIGNEKAACIYILNSIAGRIKSKPESAGPRFGLSNKRLTYLISYVKIIYKEETLEFKSDERENYNFTSKW